MMPYQGGGLQGLMGGSNFVSSPGSLQLSQQSKKFFELSQQHSSPQESQNRSQGGEQQDPLQQAYLQYALQAAQQKSALAMQSQQQSRMGIMAAASGKDPEMRMGNLKMQERMSMQAANQTQALSSRNSSEHFSHGEKQMEKGPQMASDQRNVPKPPMQQANTEQFSPANFRQMHMQQNQQSIQNMSGNQFAMAAQLQAMQAWAMERGIDLSNPANANLVAQLIPMMQSRMAAQHKANENNVSAQFPPSLVSKQQVASPPVASENSPHANSSSDVSGQSASGKTRQALPASSFGSTSGAGLGNSNSIAMQQSSSQGRENQVPSGQMVAMGNGMPPMHPPQSSLNISQPANQPVHVKSSLGSLDSSQTQQFRQLSRSSPQSTAPSNDGTSSSRLPNQSGHSAQTSQRLGFTKHQLHVLKAQILAFRRLKV